MSPRKLTEDDKQEILQQYRNSEATTSTLAESFEVSSSTISRFLKNKLSTTEYEDLIQEKRLARTPRGEKSLKAEGTAEKAKVKSTTKNTKTKSKPKSKAQTPETQPKTVVTNDLVLEENTPSPEENELPQTTPRRRRRRSTVSELAPAISDLASEIVENEFEQPQAEEVTIAPRLILDKKIRSRTELAEADDDKPSNMVSQRLILKGDRVEAEEEEDDEMDIITLKEMLGEDLEDINDEEDEEDDDEDWEDDDEPSYPPKSSDLGDIKILPLSQALLPRTCYLVIDRSAELIVKPLADFADLGIIPDTEVRQRTLPVFDNHRIAKRFSHRRERVIKVPDGRMLQKTSHHLQDKGITRLLIDGQVYSISS